MGSQRAVLSAGAPPHRDLPLPGKNPPIPAAGARPLGCPQSAEAARSPPLLPEWGFYQLPASARADTELVLGSVCSEVANCLMHDVIALSSDSCGAK